MPGLHLIRVGALANVGRFASLDANLYPRGTRIVARTARGLELGEILAPPDDLNSFGESDGAIVRAMTIEDRLLEARLAKNSHAAYQACQERLVELGLSVCLMDVEHLFDGRTLVFYFLGDVPPELEAVTEELTEIYDAKVQFRSFTDSVINGCGPGCGTDEAEGGGCSSCATGCAIAGACAPRKR